MTEGEKKEGKKKEEEKEPGLSSDLIVHRTILLAVESDDGKKKGRGKKSKEK